jgi:hypothetical protein
MASRRENGPGAASGGELLLECIIEIDVLIQKVFGAMRFLEGSSTLTHR